METEIGMTQSHDKERWQLPEAGREKERILP